MGSVLVAVSRRTLANTLILSLWIVATLLASTGLLATTARARNTDSQSSPQQAPPPLPSFIPRARWSEDWSLLIDTPTDYDVLGPRYKHIELNERGDAYLSLGGEYRLTYERFDPSSRGLNDIGTEDVALHRFAGHADVHLGRNWRVFGQLGYSTSNDRTGGRKSGDESDPNIWQLFVDHRHWLNDSERLDVRIGRQFIEKGNWLIGNAEARNVRQYFDGIRGAWLDEGFLKLDIFASEFVDASEDSFDMNGTDEYFWGSSVGFREQGGIRWSAFYFGWDLKDLQFEQGGGARHDETRHTISLWVSKPPVLNEHWSFDYYLLYQFGHYDDENNADIEAYAAFGGFKYALRLEERTPTIGLRTSIFSGDDDPKDDELNTAYNPLFVTPYFSFARDVMPYNLLHVQPSIGYRYSTRLQFSLATNFYWRESKDDAFYTGGSAIGVAAGASDARFIGYETELGLVWKPNRHIVAWLNLIHFEADDVVLDGGGEDQDYVRLDLSYMF